MVYWTLFKKLLSSHYFYIIIGSLFLGYQVYNLGYDNCKTEWDESVVVIKKANDDLLDKKNKRKKKRER
jgi:hypothetical protein